MILSVCYQNKNCTKSLRLKTWLIMKLTIVLLLFFTFQGSAKSYAQKVTIVKKQVRLPEVFKVIEQQTGFLFFYDKALIQKTSPIDITLINATLEEALSASLKGQQLIYTIVNNTIVILPEKVNHNQIQSISMPMIPEPPPPIGIYGRVVNSKGEPLQNVSIIISGTKIGTTTDNDGRFTLTVPDNKNIVLEISSVGFQTKTLRIRKQTEINVTLVEEVSGLNEVVVIGYGTAKKKDVTGAVQNVSAKRLLDKPVVNLGQALQSKVAGVEVISQGAGVPGSMPMIRIRGTNSINSNNDPLFVVDGVVGVSNPLSSLNPQDIVSLDVLKDASSTAIYGARGANGVIIITTKRGINGKTQIEYNSSLSVGVLQRHLYTLTADQLMYVYLQAMANGNKYGKVNAAKDFRGPTAAGQSFSEMPWLFKQVSKGSYLLPLVGKDGNYYAPIYNSDWESLIFRPSISNDQHIDIRGGNENAKFSLSLGYSDQEGLMKESFFRRYTGRITGDVKVLKWLNLSTSLSFIKSKQTQDDGITRSTAEVWSILPTKYPNDPALGSYAGRWGTNGDFNVGEQWYNILFRRSQIYGRNNVGQATGSFTLNAKITNDLSFKSDFSIDYNTYKNNYYSGKLYGGDGSASINVSNTFYWQNEDYFNYDKSIGKNHHISAVLGLSWSQFNWENVGASNSVFLSNFYGWSNLSAGAATRPNPSSSDGLSALNSYFGRINYTFKDKYLLTLTGREDGSSKFGANNKYGFFPSAGIAWRVSQENFMKNIDAISSLKLRASVGRTGNQEIGSYVTQSYISTTSVVLGTAAATGLYPSSVGNPDLKWETTTQSDAGMELGLLHDRINLIVDFYHKVTSNMLLNVPLPLSTTAGSVKENYGQVQNEGWEFTLGTRNIVTNNFKWSTDITVTANRNKILQLGPTGAPIYDQTGAGNGTSVLMVGAPIGSFFGLTRLGVYSTEETSLAARYGMKPGDLKFLDRNNDGKIDLLTDGGIIGNAFPKWVIGFNNTITYKSFDASLDVQIVQGVTKAFVHESAEDRQLVSGGLNSTLDAWRPDHQNTQVAQMRPGNGGAYYQSYPDTHEMYDASFIRGANGTIGYTFSDKVVKRIGFQRFRIYLNASNFFLITKAAGYDPQGSSLDKQIPLVPNTDKYQYPVPSVYSFGVNVSF
jgi:TonB-linked SusC/RagA family outer membrane protein